MQHFSYFAKAYAAALYSGLIYLMANIAPEATKLSDISLLVWIGFAAAILGSFGVTAVVSNGPNPADIKARVQAAFDAAKAAEAAKQVSLAATAVDVPAPAAPVTVEAPVEAAPASTPA